MSLKMFYVKFIIVFMFYKAVLKVDGATSTSPYEEYITRLEMVEAKTELSETRNQVVHQDLILVQRMLENIQMFENKLATNLSEKAASCLHMVQQDITSLQSNLDSKILYALQNWSQQGNQDLHQIQQKLDDIDSYFTTVMNTTLLATKMYTRQNTEHLRLAQTKLEDIKTDLSNIINGLEKPSEIVAMPSAESSQNFRLIGARLDKIERNLTWAMEAIENTSVSIAVRTQSINDGLLSVQRKLENFESKLTAIKNDVKNSSDKATEFQEEIGQTMATILSEVVQIQKGQSMEGIKAGCHEVSNSGVYYINAIPGKLFKVYCDSSGWTVFQRRLYGNVDFNRNWTEYKNGFGDLEGNFWLGNDIIHILTQVPSKLRIDMESVNGTRRYAEYSHFQISNETDKYRLYTSGVSGTVAGDSMDGHSGQQFRTNDDYGRDTGSCADRYKSGWWFGMCFVANLNGLYIKQDTHKAIQWTNFFSVNRRYDDLRYSQMSLKRV